jgi:plasmid stabilization system protein ParE
VTTYSVVLTEQAARELEAAADWWAAHRSAKQAAQWYEGFSARIESLRHSHDGCQLSEEDPDFSYELRELHFGGGSRLTHRAIFTIVSDFVVVLTIRHAAQRELQPGDVEFDPTSI